MRGPALRPAAPTGVATTSRPAGVGADGEAAIAALLRRISDEQRIAQAIRCEELIRAIRSSSEVR